MDSWFDSSEKYERQLTALKEAVEKLRDAIDTVFGQRSKHPRKVVNIEDVRMDERYYKKGRA